MFSLGGYPLGASDDSRAPYNQPDPVEVECPDCGGSGYADEPRAVEIETGREFPFTEAAWRCLPTCEEQARLLGKHYYQAEREVCETCDGEGRIEVESADLDDDGFDELAAEERYYEDKYGND